MPHHHILFLAGLLSCLLPSTLASNNSSYANVQKACQLLNATFPNLVSFPGSPQYDADILHWAVSSQQNVTCSIEPESSDDVSTILKIVGRDDIMAPFAVKGGGHAYNVGFSSTTGVQISMARFNAVTYDATSETVVLGTGLTWDQVYEQLEPFGVMVTGGRIPGVGIAGLSLGGGYSWKTDQYGLTVDTIVAHDLILPSGEAVHVTNSTYPDLFFGLKGAQNNFGIVTAITYETHPQTLVFGGGIVFAQNVTDSVHNATAKFSLTNTDPKAQIIIEYSFEAGEFVAQAFPFYDAPTVPAGIFDDFLNIPSLSKDVKTRTFVDFLNATFGNGTVGVNEPILAGHVVPILNYTVPILEEMASQIKQIGTSLSAQFNNSEFIVTYAPEPFTKPFAHSQGGAYPHPPTRQVTPSAPLVEAVPSASTPDGLEAAIASAVKEIAKNVQAKAVEEGQSQWDDLLYPNYALADTPLELMYGDNVERLNALAKAVDPRGVMKLTGGFKFG